METGNISIAIAGDLERGVTVDALRLRLRARRWPRGRLRRTTPRDSLVMAVAGIGHTPD